MIIDREYNCRQLDRMDELLAKNKKSYTVDLHIHTCYSADGLQSVEQAIQKAIDKRFDIISIADHDAIGAYNEIKDQGVYEIQNMPIIIPGIEFSVSYSEYEGRCHVLKYFFDTNNQGFQDNLAQNHRAYWNRVQLWMQRINENRCLQSFFNQYGITCSEKGYRDYLKNCTVKIPEYPTLMGYLYTLLSKMGVDVWDVYEKTVKDNDADKCEIRRERKRKAFKRFYDKYNHQDISHNYRKLRPILAPVGIDDADYPEFTSSGCLSVNEYGQVPIHRLINSGFNVLAHPDGNKLHCVDKLTDVLLGLELNYRSDAGLNEAVQKKARSMPLLLTKGSDKHSDTDGSYDDLNFYSISYEDLAKISIQARHAVLNGKA